MRNVEVTRWIHKDLIKPFQNSIGLMGPRRCPAEKEKVEDVRNKYYIVLLLYHQVLKQFPISTSDVRTP